MRRLHIAPSGAVIETAACSTPGTARTRWWMRSHAARRAAGARSARRASITAQHATALEAERHLRQSIERPQEQAGADEEHEREDDLRQDEPARHRVRLDAPGSVRDPSSRRWARRASRHAGATPKTSAAMRPAAAVNASMRESSGSSRDTASVASWATRSRLPQCATATPAAAPMAASSRLSISSWRASRPRDAPSASRTLHSWPRAVARASSRLAMLAQAISSTSPRRPSGPAAAAVVVPETRWTAGRIHERERLGQYLSDGRPGLDGGRSVARESRVAASASALSPPRWTARASGARTNTWSHHDVRRSRRDSLPRMSGSAPRGSRRRTTARGEPKNPAASRPRS